MWRVGFPTPRDVDDNQSYCGGYGVQYGSNGGKCGICGDPWHENPRAHEAPGGLYATGIIGAYIKKTIKVCDSAKKKSVKVSCHHNIVLIFLFQKCYGYYHILYPISNLSCSTFRQNIQTRIIYSSDYRHHSQSPRIFHL